MPSSHDQAQPVEPDNHLKEHSEPESVNVSEARTVGEPVPTRPTAGRRRRRSGRPNLRHPAVLAVASITFLLAAWYGFHAYAALAAYRDVSADARALNQYEHQPIASLSVTDLRQMETYFADIDANLNTIDRATTVPLLDPVIRVLPWIGPRFEAGRELIATGKLLSGAGEDGARIGAETLAAFDNTGFSTNGEAVTGTTWLDVLGQSSDNIDSIAADIEDARSKRASINVDVLPRRVQAKVADLDRILDRYDYESLARDTVPAATAALGVDGPVRYWVLFPNPAETRPGGGFPGTGALVTFERGQLVSYEFHDMKQVSDEYLAERSEIVPPPVPIATYLWDDGFLPHDTIWWSDFTRTGEDFMRLYAEIDWPEIAGVVAVQPTAVADLLTVTGNVVVDVDGEQREITPENVFLEMERQRAQDRGGADVDVNHKDVIASVGQEIMTRLKTADRQQLRQIANLLQAAADRRDIQGYAVNQDVQAILDERRWSGRITPDPATPTLAVTFSNMVATKSSLTMFPDVTVNVGPRDGQARIVTLDVTLRHEGTNEADPFYSGFQRWWIQVDLPEGSEFISSENPLQDDPDAPDGGAYLLELFPQQSGTVRLTFRMPDTERLLFRRQPGVNPVTLAVEGETCADIEPEDVLADITLNLADRCP